MCFSAQASFGVGAALIPAGVYCVRSALVKKPRYLGLAAVPLLFGIQQISEGFVWQAIERHDNARTASLFFLFFALAFWPFWFPFMAACMETQPWRKRLFIVLSVLAVSWFWILFYPLLVGPVSLLKTVDKYHSIRYEYDGLPVYHYIDKFPLRLLYLLSVALPPILGSESFGRMPGVVLGLSAVIAALVYDYAFVSVWCFFAAILASYCCVLFYRLPMPAAHAVQPAHAHSSA